MAIYTPRGLKIRIHVSYAFGLMARLYPKVSPFRVLKTTEGIEYLPGMFAFIAGMIAYIMHLPPFQIGLAVAVAQLVGELINLFAFYVIPGLVTVSTLFSYISGYGLLLVVTFVVGFVFVGWQGVLAFYIGKLIAEIISQCLEFWKTKRSHKLTGLAFTSSEVNFFNAYRFHASRIGVTTDIDLKDKETEQENWEATFEDLAKKWPEVVERFTTD